MKKKETRKNGRQEKVRRDTEILSTETATGEATRTGSLVPAESS